MPKYYKISDKKSTLYVTVDDSGAVILTDPAGNKVFLSKYQAKLMKFGIENLIQDLFKGSDSKDVKAEEIEGIPRPK